MDNERALAIFEQTPTSTSSERLRAARFLAQNATNTHRNRLSKIREVEGNSWVRQALDQALSRSGNKKTVASADAVEEVQETPIDKRLYEELRAQAIEETSGWFLHELRPLVGFLDADADAEIDRYACSRTKASISRIQSFLDAMERLRKASAAPAIQEFDLTDLVVRVAADEARQGRATLGDSNEEADETASLDEEVEQIPQQSVIKLALARSAPLITVGDPTLVEMAVANALRNAIEALAEVQEVGRRTVILNWGVTDTDSWIVVLDEGCGLPPGWDRLTEPGISTKKNQGHLGMGLTIAQRALESARGKFRLAPRTGPGVSCEIRWLHGGTMN